MPTHPAVLPSDPAPVAKPRITTVEFWTEVDDKALTINRRANGLWVVEDIDGSELIATKKLHTALLRALEMAGGDQ